MEVTYLTYNDWFLTENDTLLCVDEDYFSDPRKDMDNLGALYLWNGGGDDIPYAWDEKTGYAFLFDHYVDCDNVLIQNIEGEFRKRGELCLPLVLNNGEIDIADERNTCYAVDCDGVIFVSKERLLEEYSNLSDKTFETAKKVLEGEIDLFNDYLRGDIFCAEIIDPKTAETIDSCGGFYGTNGEENGIFEGAGGVKEYLGNYANLEDCLRANSNILGIVIDDPLPLNKRVHDKNDSLIHDVPGASLRNDKEFQDLMKPLHELAEYAFESASKYGFDPGDPFWEALIGTIRDYSNGELTDIEKNNYIRESMNELE